MKKTKKDSLTLLGTNTKYPQKPEDAFLETFDNKHQDIDYLVPFVCNEFTSLCPKTGQPDFAKIEIIYIPRVEMIESKALKLYLFSFRNEGSFHEDVINRMFKDLWAVLDPKFMRIIGDFTVRGGIAIKPMVARTNEKDNLGGFHTQRRELVAQWDRIKSNLQ